MKKIVEKIIGSDLANLHKPYIRQKYAALQAWLSIILNLFIFAVKLIIGLSINSLALIADAIHTLSDCGSSIVILIGFKVSSRPGDRQHPFGHGQAEHITGLIVAMMLIMAGFELLKTAFGRILEPGEMVSVGPFIYFVVIFTIILKELLGRFAFALGSVMKSQALQADGWHHRSDALSTIIVLFALWSNSLGWLWVDGVVGLLVALMVIYCGYFLAKQAISPLLGEKPALELVESIEKIANNVEGVEAVHDIIVHQYGQTRMISLHIEVQSQLDVFAISDIAKNVEKHLCMNLCQYVIVHIDPINSHHPYYKDIYQALGQLIKAYPEALGFAELRIIGHNQDSKAIFSVIVPTSLSASKSRFILENLYKSLKSQFPQIKFIIKFKPQYCV